MPKKGNLFLLIKSLTKAEKRYFKVFASTGNGNKNYLLLFDYLDRQEVYNEKALKEHFKDKTFSRQLHVTKIYLNNLILKSLRNYHAKISKGAELKDLLRDIEILFKKELFAQCHYVIEKAIKTARKYDRLPELLELYFWKRKLQLAKRDHFENRQLLNQLLHEEKETLEKLFNLNGFWDLTLNMFDNINQDNLTDHKFLENPLLRNDGEAANSFPAKTLYFHVLYAYHTVTRNAVEAERKLTELIEFLEAHPEKISDDPASYVTALNNKIGHYLFNKKLDRIPELLEKVKSIPEKYGLSEQNPFTIKLQVRRYNLELELYRDTRDYEKGVQLAQEVGAFVEKYNTRVPLDYQLLFYYQFAYFHFMLNDYQNALNWLNEILRTNYGTLREDIQSYAQLLNLVIHFELGNTMILKYAVESCRRFLKKKRNLQPFENALLKFFAKISMSSPGEHKKLMRKLHSDLFIGMEEAAIQNVLDYFDFRGWLDRKVGN